MTDFGAIGAAVIGTGFIGTVHGWALRRLGVRLEGVLGSSPARGAERAGAMGVRRAYATLEELIADPNVDVVHVTSPNHAHFPQVKRCSPPASTLFARSRWR
jgi:predicted dehydrogenase